MMWQVVCKSHIAKKSCQYLVVPEIHSKDCMLDVRKMSSFPPHLKEILSPKKKPAGLLQL